MTFSVVIVNYNVKVFLEHALGSVCKAMAGIKGEVIVVDNASDDGSVEMIRQKFPQVKLIPNQRNLGFAAANNIGIKESSGELILLLNPDTLVQEDTFQVMIDFFAVHEEAGLAGCKILNPDGSLQLSCRRSFPTPWVAFTKVTGLSALFPSSTLFGKYNLTYRVPDETYEVDAISGSFMLFRRSVYDEIGGLDEQFFMYGEDLDWCYRVKQAGWFVYYVHSTQIIHYKGQSARRSDIDEVKMFYEAMRVFVRKYIRRGFFSDVILHTGISLHEWIASVGKIVRPLWTAVIDYLIVDLSLFLGELFWFGELFHLPTYAYPVTMTIPALIVTTTLYSSGIYTSRKLSINRVTTSVIAGYVILSALTFFFKQYAFSRMMVLISGGISIVLLPGWRLLARLLLRPSEHRGAGLFGRRTVIVGAESSGQEVLRKLRARVDDGYNVVGFIDLSRKHVGEKIAGVEILGSIDNIGKVIEEQKVSEVIFSTDILSYGDILAVIGRRRRRAVNFRLVPSSLEVIIGKSHIDELDDIPLVDIEYNIDKPSHRLLKRLFDISLGSLLMVTFYPLAHITKKSGDADEVPDDRMLLLPKVLRGEMSLVGPSHRSPHEARNGSMHLPLYYGKPGLTGLVQVNYHDHLTEEEIGQYDLYYAKNQSLMLDVEILVKSILLKIKG